MSLKTIKYQVEKVGKIIKGYLWDFEINEKRHNVILEYSNFSSKRRIFIDGVLKYFQDNQLIQILINRANYIVFSFPFKLEKVSCIIVQQDNKYELKINNKDFSQRNNKMNSNGILTPEVTRNLLNSIQMMQKIRIFEKIQKNPKKQQIYFILNNIKSEEHLKVKLNLNLAKTNQNGRTEGKSDTKQMIKDFSNFNFDDFVKQRQNNSFNYQNGDTQKKQQIQNSNIREKSNSETYQNENIDTSNTTNEFNFYPNSRNSDLNKVQTIDKQSNSSQNTADNTIAQIQQVQQIDLLDVDQEQNTPTQNQEEQQGVTQQRVKLLDESDDNIQPIQQNKFDLMIMYNNIDAKKQLEQTLDYQYINDKQHQQQKQHSPNNLLDNSADMQTSNNQQNQEQKNQQDKQEFQQINNFYQNSLRSKQVSELQDNFDNNPFNSPSQQPTDNNSNNLPENDYFVFN